MADAGEHATSHVGYDEWRRRFDSPTQWQGSGFTREDWDAREEAYNAQVDAFTNGTPWVLPLSDD